MTPAVSIRDLKKAYGPVVALQSVSLEVPPGCIFGLLGPNGAGKSTTLRCLCTLTQPDSGAVEVFGVSALTQPRQVRQLLGYVAQEIALDKVLTGRELLAFQGALYHISVGELAGRIADVLGLLDLDAWADRRIGTYSGGLKKRLDLAAGLLHQPPLLVLDEPTVGLDIESRQVIWAFLRQLRERGTTLLLTSHYLEEVDALADQVAIIDQGRVIASGTPGDLKAQVGGERITLRLREFTPLAEAQTARQLLAGLPWVQDVIVNAAQGNSLNLVTQPIDNALTQVQQALQVAGLPVFSLAQARPSLDDVYLAATGRTLADAELAAAERVGARK